MHERLVPELIARLARITHGDGFNAGLTPAQWSALRYFARANQFSRTPSAFAEYHSTTRGTASQTTKSLVEQGYLVRMRSRADGRSVRLDLTDKAQTALANDPFELLVRAADALSVGARGEVADALVRMLDDVSRERGKVQFGSCRSCEHLNGDRQDRKSSYVCGRLDTPLTEAELEQLCIDFSRLPPDMPSNWCDQ